VKFDAANRSFAALFGASVLVGMFAFCGAVACILLGLVVSQVAEDGIDAYIANGDAVWPALAFIAIVAAGVVLGVRSLRDQIGGSRKLSRRVGEPELVVPVELSEAATRARLGGRVKLLDTDERFSFAYGALTPRVAVSRGLLEAASAAELDAVLEHERYHVRNLDPLKSRLRARPPPHVLLPAGAELPEGAIRRGAGACRRSPRAEQLRAQAPCRCALESRPRARLARARRSRRDRWPGPPGCARKRSVADRSTGLPPRHAGNGRHCLGLGEGIPAALRLGG
jgi:peptidase M48-like protein